MICVEPRSLTGIRAFRVDNEVPEPITGIQGICSDVFADNGVVNIDDPQLSVLIGVEQDDIRDSACPLGAVVTGFRGRAGDGDRRNGEGGTGRGGTGKAERGRRNGSAQWC
ncbi:MAG: hypothetical protein H0V64_09490 [Geodermatophilaceae bacterium]|nr:hypothetical protein [Geodermatophilaceae bacterium]